MGSVFAAVNEVTGGHAAIKILDEQLGSDAEGLARFFQEARAAARVRHPGIAAVHDLIVLPSGNAAIIMELLDGELLRTRLTRGCHRLPLAEALRVARQLASALTATHDCGVIHRDLKPDNIMIVADSEAPGGERAKILDFGIAKIAADHHLGSAATATQPGTLIGTPAYMAPEQCTGIGAIDQQADVYALGVIIYEMLAGTPPFLATGQGELLGMHIFVAPPELRDQVPDVPAGLAALVHHMLAKQPTDRPTMRAVAAQLATLSGHGEARFRESAQEVSSRWQSREVGKPARAAATSALPRQATMVLTRLGTKQRTVQIVSAAGVLGLCLLGLPVGRYLITPRHPAAAGHTPLTPTILQQAAPLPVTPSPAPQLEPELILPALPPAASVRVPFETPAVPKPPTERSKQFLQLPKPLAYKGTASAKRRNFAKNAVDSAHPTTDEYKVPDFATLRRTDAESAAPPARESSPTAAKGKTPPL